MILPLVYQILEDISKEEEQDNIYMLGIKDEADDVTVVTQDTEHIAPSESDDKHPENTDSDIISDINSNTKTAGDMTLAVVTAEADMTVAVVNTEADMAIAVVADESAIAVVADESDHEAKDEKTDESHLESGE